MRIAVLSDIHGNVCAFESALKMLRRLSPDIYVFLGDLVVNGLYPQECYDMLLDLAPEIIIQGNTDGFFQEITPNRKPSNEREAYAYKLFSFAQERLNDNAVKQLISRPIYRKIPEFKLGLCHGTPFSYEDKLESANNSEHLREKIDLLGHDILLFGHTHVPADFMLGATRCLSFGAVGYSFDGITAARCGILDITKSTVRTTQLHIEYPVSDYEREVSDSKAPFADNLS
ncbi:MAG: metallophosphoesterase family protein, partial [Spirochaetales bacterium]|nr:metallophosphoesterase family protein [Spirochaetales bacterium]